MKSRNRIVEAEFPLFHQHHDRYADHRFRHRRHTEHRIPRHRFLCLHVRHALHIEVGNLTSPSNEHHSAGDFTRFHAPLDELLNAIQSFLRQPDSFRTRCGQGIRGGNRQRCKDEDDQRSRIGTTGWDAYGSSCKKARDAPVARPSNRRANGARWRVEIRRFARARAPAFRRARRCRRSQGRASYHQ